MRREGIAVLVGFRSDHNVCDECKRKEATTAARKMAAALVQLSTAADEGEEHRKKMAEAEAEVTVRGARG